MSSLSDLLKHANDGLKNLENFTSTRVVVGNESCDLDSVACTLSLAHYYSVVEPTSLTLPLLNCLREDFPLRKDIEMLLVDLKINPDDLLFLPEVDIGSLPDPSISLVDHNVPQLQYASLVKEIIDHHQDAEAVTCHRVIETVGSCSTLVGQKLLHESNYTLQRELATLLLAAILVDTGDLKSDDRTTVWDKDVATELRSLVTSSHDLYYKVLAARDNITNLTTLQVLRKDFKKADAGEFHIGFSSMPILITELASTRLHLASDLELFCGNEGLYFLVLLGINLKPLRRQIALYQPPNLPPKISGDIVDSVAATLELDTVIQVERIGEGTFDGIIMEQGNTSLSRKQIMPMITECLLSRDSEMVPEAPLIAEVTDEDEKITRTETEGSMLQLESISVRLGESMDSFALAQDSDDEHSKTYSPNPSLTNLCSISSIEERHTLEGAPIPPPLEPEVIVSTGAMPTPAILPDEPMTPPIPEYSFEQESEDSRTFRYVAIDGEERRISLKLIEQYRSIIQHGGYIGNDKTAVIVISSYYLPPKSLHNYQQVISQTFFYVLSVLDKLVVDDYVIVYLHSGAPRNSMPGIQWFHRFYKMIDRRLRKNLKELYIVHPTFWVKTMLRLVRPIISRKFYRKVHFVGSLQSLKEYVQLDSMLIPEAVRRADYDINPSHYSIEQNV